jgi:hypothetical protein
MGRHRGSAQELHQAPRVVGVQRLLEAVDEDAYP